MSGRSNQPKRSISLKNINNKLDKLGFDGLLLAQNLLGTYKGEKMKRQGIVEETTDFDEKLTVEIDCFLCPISLEVMENPVVTIYGHSYHGANIENWLDSHTSDPNTGQPLTKAQLFPNFNLRSAIETWKKLDTQWEKHVAVYKTMQAEKKLQHMKISDLEAEKTEYEEKIKELTEESDKLKQKCIVANKRFHAIHRKKTEGPKGHSALFLQHLEGCFPKEFIKIKTALDEENLKQLLEVIATLEEMLVLSKGESKEFCILYAMLGYVYENLGRLTINADYYQKAHLQYKKIESLSIPEDFLAELYTRQGWTLYRIQMHAENISREQRIAHLNEATSLYDAALKINQTLCHTLANKGSAFKALYAITKEKKYEQLALDTFTLLIETEKSDVAYLERGKIHSSRENYEQAFAEFEKAISINPTAYNHKEVANSYKWHALKCAQEKSQKRVCFEKAVEHYKVSLAQYSQDENVYCDLGFCLTNLGPPFWEEAMQYYKEGLLIEPTHELILSNIEKLKGRMQSQKKGYIGGSAMSQHHHVQYTQSSSSSSSSSNPQSFHNRGGSFRGRGQSKYHQEPGNYSNHRGPGRW